VTIDHETCLTCGDAAIIATVVEVHGQTAVVDVEGLRDEVGVELVTPVGVGDRLLCHAGIALERLQEPEAEE
jgi:hydrogenase maturation factor